MRKSRLPPATVYLFIEIAASASFSMMFVVLSLYEVTVAGLTPLQLVLVGTAVEASAFLFEIPTGVVADSFSRRLSIIIGYILMGAGFMIEGLFPAFLPIILAQVVWGLGYTFTSGATQAWISDEIGEKHANKLFLRGTQLGLVASLAGMVAAGFIGANNAVMPIRVGGLLVMMIGFALILIMPESGFKPAPKEERNTWRHMWHTFNQGVKTIRSRPRLMSIVGVGLFFGLYSEGFDRLWLKHLLDTFELPIIFGSNQVVFLAMLRMIAALLSMAVLRLVEKRVDISRPEAIGRTMIFITAAISFSIILFALSPFLLVSLALYPIIQTLRNTGYPLQNAWINQKLPPSVRATVHSMFGQVDAIGQIMGGPAAALVAGLASVAAAITSSGALLLPALLLERRANLTEKDEETGSGAVSTEMEGIAPEE